MARARNIKPSFFQNEELGELSPLTRLAFIGMWTIADYKGCIEFRPKRLKVQIMPYDDCDFEQIANDLDKSGLIAIYSVQGQRYIKIINFEKHQNPHKNERESGSDIPDIAEKDSEINDLSKDGNTPDKDGTARADSLLLIPDSLNLNPDSNNSVPIGTGDKSPAAKKEKQKTPEEQTKAELWASGKSILMQAKMPKEQCGSFIGKLCKDYGDDIAVEAVRITVVKQPADPAEFMKATCQRLKGEKKSVQPWWLTERTVLAKGEELGLPPRAGEAMAQYKARLEEAIYVQERAA
jgi:hypothetical protein